MRVGDLFAFFEQALRLRNPKAFDQFDDALRRLPDASLLETEILRTVLILQIANTAATAEFLHFCVADCSPSESQAGAVQSALRRLNDAGSLWQNAATTVLEFLGSGSVRTGVESEIEDEMALLPQIPPTRLFRESQEIHHEIADFLGDFDLDPAPSGIVRTVSVRVLDVRAGSEAVDVTNPAASGDDTQWRSAMVYLVVANTLEELQHWRTHAISRTETNLFFVLPQGPVVLSDKVHRLVAVSRVLARKERGEHAYRVLEAQLTKLREDLRAEFANVFGTDGLRTGTEIIRCGSPATTVAVESWGDLFPAIGDALTSSYGGEPKVRCGRFNEWMKRGESWSHVERICERILGFDTHADWQKDLLGFKETSAEAAIVDGVLIENGVLKRDVINDTWVFTPVEQLGELFREITKYVQGASTGEKEFLRLYSRLIEPPYGVPNGVIPLLLAVVIRADAARIALYRRRNGQPTRVQEKLHEALVAMVKDPGSYATRYTKLTLKQRYVFKAIGPELGQPFTARDDRGEAFYDYCGRVRDAMIAWRALSLKRSYRAPTRQKWSGEY